jgi:coenzyme F420-0:L-glutamate ligase/coenzyme F420-1:gamma-L-glutamate ligase
VGARIAGRYLGAIALAGASGLALYEPARTRYRAPAVSHRPSSGIACGPRLELSALPGLPLVVPGDDLAALLLAALARAGLALADGDVIAIASKLVSRAEGRFVPLSRVEPSPRAVALAARAGKDPRIAELVLREASEVSRVAPGAIIVRHRLGFVSANAGIDQSNAGLPGAEPSEGPFALLLPEAPDASAERLRRALSEASGAAIGVVVTDSFGRPFRLGTVGAAIGVAGLPALWDQRGGTDLFGRVLEQTVTALADQVAAAADLVAGQAAEGRGAVLVRGLRFPVGSHSARELARPREQDLYAGPRGGDDG